MGFLAWAQGALSAQWRLKSLDSKLLLFKTFWQLWDGLDLANTGTTALAGVQVIPFVPISVVSLCLSVGLVDGELLD